MALGNIIHKLSDSKIYFIVIILPLLFCLLSYLYQLIRILIFGAEDEDEEYNEEEEKEEQVEMISEIEEHK